MEQSRTEDFAARAEAGAAPCPRQPCILLVDDDSFMLGVQARALENMGYRDVFTANSAVDGLARLCDERMPIDVVFCDLNMPAMDGIEFLQRLETSDFRGSVILLSGEGARIMHSVRKLLGTGSLCILGALEKPAGTPALRSLLDLWRPPLLQETPGTPLRSFSAAEIDQAARERQWVLHYQPKVSFHDASLVGFEALVRWQHPLYGLVYPDSFIAIAEECGAIDSLTNWVMQEATARLANWHLRGLHVQIALNVSMENLGMPDFARRVSRCARDHGVSPRHITLEITESRLMSTAAAPLESLVRLRLQKFGLSIDDFGTGHSSLSQLRDVPFTELKIDRGFVHGARFNQIIRPILEGSIGIAKRMHMTSVAEGCETEEDWHLLREIGCDLGQGYFIGRPLPHEKVAGWIQEWQGRAVQLREGKR